MSHGRATSVVLTTCKREPKRPCRKGLAVLTRWGALPVITFSDSASFHLNGYDVLCFHVANAHTDGDVMVWFRGSDVIAAGTKERPVYQITIRGHLFYKLRKDEAGLTVVLSQPVVGEGYHEDPDRAWAEVGPYVLHEVQRYTSFQTPGQKSLPSVHAASIEELRSSPQYLVGTPEEVVAGLRALPPTAGAVLNPLAGGTPPELAWPALECFAGKVLPHLA